MSGKNPGRLAKAFLCAAAVCALAFPAGAAGENVRRHEMCLAQVERDPEEAFETAQGLRALGEMLGAEHCTAAALVGLGQYDEAARRFEALARGGNLVPGAVASFLGHAAQALLLGGRPGRAVDVLSEAVRLAPADGELWVDRAAAFAAAGNYAGALADLDRALAVSPANAQALVFRATAKRFLDRLGDAQADLERALILDPRNPEGLLEWGILRRLADDNEGARRAWLSVLDVAPGTDAARAARANLERMDLRVR
ncbi:MAG: hypothetical protein QGG17_09280 [Rhodospirillales bacterium]|jgi:tetratricopeptide (TPR) repeat protein|nr:hypothetical protein [Rhodospirillales bacterium]MDP6803989.1 hypothetical protein [Rhodospirillales bacterium]